MLETKELLVDDPLTDESWDAHWKVLVGTWGWQGDALKGVEMTTGACAGDKSFSSTSFTFVWK